MNFIKRMLTFILKGVLSFLLILIIASVVIITLEIRVELNYLNKPVEIAVEKILDRDFSMKGDVVLIPTLWPTLEINDVSIANPQGKQWQIEKALIHFGRLRLQLGLVPLLSGEIHVAEMTAEEVTLNLESDVNGNSNWDFELPEGSSEEEQAAQQIAEDSTASKSLFQFEALDKILFKQINVHYIDQTLKKSVHFNLEQLEGDASPNEDINLKFNGKLQDKDYSVNLKGGGLDIFRDKSQPWPLTMDMIVAGTDIALSGELKRGKEPELSATLDVGKTDIGATLSWFNIMDGLHIGSEHLNISARVQGDSLSELIRDAELSIVLQNAWWNLTDKNTGAELPIKITEGSIKIAPQKPVQVELKGLLDKSNINIYVTGAPAIDYMNEDAKTPLVLAIKTHGADVTLKTQLSQSMNVNNMGFNLVFKGVKLSDLNQLTRMDLPPLGPYSLQGFFAMTANGYQIKDLLLNVQESQLKGDMLLDMQSKPPFLKIGLNSKQIQINNFDVGEWTPAAVPEKSVDEDKNAAAKAEQAQSGKENKEAALKLLSYETLSRFDVDIQLAVEQVLSGKDTLGSGSASLELKNARLNLQLVELKFPGGDASADLVYHPSGNKSLDIALQVKMKGFDYGIMARRIDPKSEVGGLIALDIDLSSNNAKNMNSLLVNSRGHLDFVWRPEALDADLFEMWAVNLISSLLKNADKDESSKVNCVIGRFVLDNGMMREKVIFADTTKMRMAGTAEANFKDRTIKVKVAPKAKKAEFFSLATPVGVAGSFDDFGISVNPLSLTQTVVSFITSPLHVPVRRVFSKELPADGIEACQAMWKASEEIEDSVIHK